MNQNKIIRILLIGHVTPIPSGSSILFQQLLHSLLNCKEVDVKLVNTCRPNNSLNPSKLVNLWVALKTTYSVIKHLGQVDVISFHASQWAMLSYSPVLYFLSMLSKRPLVLRLFGGGLEEKYESLAGVKKVLVKESIFKSNLFLLETKYLVNYFQQVGAKNVEWFPNSRYLSTRQISKKEISSPCRSFIFLGRVIQEKGIETILKSLPHLKQGITVDIFGPLDGIYTEKLINELGKSVITYKGVIEFNRVCEILSRYDALILPTFYQSEGYPGVILEAYSQGLPVIATEWRSIPEIVDNTSGLLIPVRSSLALAEAMNYLNENPQLFLELAEGAFKKASEFSETLWTQKFLQWCQSLALDNESQ